MSNWYAITDGTRVSFCTDDSPGFAAIPAGQKTAIAHQPAADEVFDIPTLTLKAAPAAINSADKQRAIALLGTASPWSAADRDDFAKLVIKALALLVRF